MVGWHLGWLDGILGGVWSIRDGAGASGVVLGHPGWCWGIRGGRTQTVSLFKRLKMTYSLSDRSDGVGQVGLVGLGPCDVDVGF